MNTYQEVGAPNSLVDFRTGGRLYSWGRGRRTLGLETPPGRDVLAPRLVPALEDVREVSCGERHCAAVTGEGALYTWGVDAGGFGVRAASTRLYEDRSRVQVLGRRVEGEGRSVYPLVKDPFRYDDAGKRPLLVQQDWLVDDVSVEGAPGRVPLPRAVRASEVACGGLHTLVLTTAGAVYGFGSNECGQLSPEFSPDDARAVPAPVRIPRLGRARRVAACADASVVVVGDRVVRFGRGAIFSGDRCGLRDVATDGFDVFVRDAAGDLHEYDNDRNTKRVADFLVANPGVSEIEDVDRDFPWPVARIAELRRLP